MPITFSAQDVNLASFPHTDAMVVTIHIDRWDITKIRIDNRSQADILFLTAFKKWVLTENNSKNLWSPSTASAGKKIEPVRVITLSVSFSTPRNPRTEYITFDIVDMLYLYNAIFGRGLLNTFEAALHSGYLCLKIPTIFSIISVFGSQEEARNIEKGFVPGKKCTLSTRRDRATQYPHRFL
jgi:hypothetical protein